MFMMYKLEMCRNMDMQNLPRALRRFLYIKCTTKWKTVFVYKVYYEMEAKVPLNSINRLMEGIKVIPYLPER